MKRIYCLIGPSGSGKTTVYNKLMEISDLTGLKPVVVYTTRPKRTGETDGKDYYFITDNTMAFMSITNKFIAESSYNTADGTWRYGIPDVREGEYLLIATPDQYWQMHSRVHNLELIPVFVQVEEKERQRRLIEREKKLDNPNYEEISRRIETDKEDFSKEKLERFKKLIIIDNNKDYSGKEIWQNIILSMD